LKTQFLWIGVGVAEYAVNKVLRPSVWYGTVGEQVIEKTLKAYVEHQIATVSSQEIVKTISTSVSYEALVGMIRGLIITRRLKPSVSKSTGIEVIEVSDSNITLTMPITHISTEISREEHGVVNTLVTTQISVEKIA
jgi:hypothetical protein